MTINEMDGLKTTVCVLLGISLSASIFIMFTIAFRLKGHLMSLSYKFIFACKFFFAILSLSGIYLIIWPLKNRTILITLSWFTIMALSVICSAIGFWLYSRDLRSVEDRLKAHDDVYCPLKKRDKNVRCPLSR